jgi:toxin ParE1/3/4
VKPVTLHPAAETELDSAVTYYEWQREGLGLEFEEEVEATVKQIQQNPRIGTEVSAHGVRKRLVRRFPYTIFYAELDDRIWVAAIAHQKRKPGYWAKRKPGDSSSG